jgi:hypothetical protein
MESAIIMTGFPLGKGGRDDRTGRKKGDSVACERVLTRPCEALILGGGVNIRDLQQRRTHMRMKLALGALAIAAGFAAAPVFAQTAGQSGSMPGMMGASPSQPGQQAQGSGGCSCCQRMAMNQQQGQQAPRPQ